MPTHVYLCTATAPASPSPTKLGLFPSAGEAQGETRHEAEKLNPSENYFPPVGLFPFSSISPRELPRPVLSHACLPTSCS